MADVRVRAVAVRPLMNLTDDELDALNQVVNAVSSLLRPDLLKQVENLQILVMYEESQRQMEDEVRG